jgi:hypothetical protein
MKSVAQLEEELEAAKKQASLELHHAGVEAALAAVPPSFKEKMSNFEAPTDASKWFWILGNRLQGGGNDRCVIFKFTDKPSGHVITLVAGQKHGGWQPWYTNLNCTPPGERQVSVPVSFEASAYDARFPWSSHVVTGRTHAEQILWYAHLENFIKTYYAHTKLMSPQDVINLMRLALLGNDF